MKYIITNNQLTLLTESKKNQFFQDIINKTLKYIQEGCDKSYDEFPNNISFDACDVAELVEEFKLLSTQKKGGMIELDVHIIFSSIKKYVELFDLIRNMEDIINRKLGIKVFIRVSEQINKRSSFDW